MLRCGGADRGSARRVVRRAGLLQQRLQQLHALRRDRARRHGGLHGAAWLPIVPAVAESALRDEVAQLDERVLDCFRRAMRQAEHLHAG